MYFDTCDMAQQLISTTAVTTTERSVQSPTKRRDRLETYFDILQALEGGAQKPTRIMYKANLSWAILQEYLKTLEAKALIVSLNEGSRKYYRLSEKGFQVLAGIRNIAENLNFSLSEDSDKSAPAF